MIQFILVLMLSSLLGANAKEDTCKPATVGQVRQLVETDKLKEYMHGLKLKSHDCFWDSALKGIASGDSRWLSLAKDLRRFTDAGLSLDFKETMSEAIKTNPTGVLQAIQTFDRKPDRDHPEAFCDHDSYDDSPDYDATKDIAEVRKRLQSLQKVAQPELQKIKTICLEALDKSLARFVALTKPCQPVEIKEIQSLIKSKELRSHMVHLFGKDRKCFWEPITNGIVSGDSDWLAIAIEVFDMLNSTESLQHIYDAIGRALTSNPSGALAAMKKLESARAVDLLHADLAHEICPAVPSGRWSRSFHVEISGSRRPYWMRFRRRLQNHLRSSKCSADDGSIDW